MAETLDAIILAAGIGARIKSSENNLPKCLLQLDGKETILSRQITQMMETRNIDRIIISTGFEHDQIENYLEGDFRDLLRDRILLEYNPFYSISNNLVSLWNVRGLVVDSGKGIMISNGDNVYGQEFPRLIANLPADNLVVIRKKEDYDGDDMKVMIQDDDIQQINKNISSNDADGEAIGLSKFNKNGKKQLFGILDRMVKSPRHLSSFYLRAFEHLIQNEGIRLRPHNCGNMYFEEVDFPEDYQNVIRSLPT